MSKVLLGSLVLATMLSTAQAESWSNTSILFHYGSNFDKLIGGETVPDGKMETITIEHVGGWAYGTNFFFFDLTTAEFGSGSSQKLYGEWAPTLSMGKISGKDLSFAFIKDINLAIELNQGDNFRATNIGLGLDLDIPGFKVFGTNFFSRDDNFNDSTFQITMFWNSTFNLGPVPFIFEGFLDYYGTDFGTEVVTQPRLLIDGKVFGDATKTLAVGVELYYYKSSLAPGPFGHDKINEAIPQATVKWTW